MMCYLKYLSNAIETIMNKPIMFFQKTIIVINEEVLYTNNGLNTNNYRNARTLLSEHISSLCSSMQPQKTSVCMKALFGLETVSPNTIYSLNYSVQFRTLW